MTTRVVHAFDRMDRAELKLCRLLNRSSRYTPVRDLFRCVSWLGNGWIWYALIAALPVLPGGPGWIAAWHAAATGAVGVVLYKAIKNRAMRERPFIADTIIECRVVPLDRYSFPSGHTLHAVSFTLLIGYYVPQWLLPLAIFASLVAASRVVLGLHYPTDVAAGATLGGALAWVSVNAGDHLLALP